MARVEASKSNKKENQRVIDAAQLRTRKDNQSPSVMSKNCPKKLRHDRESNPGHLRDRQVYFLDMAPTTSDLYDIAGPVPCHGLATTAIPTLSAPPMTRRAAATAYQTAASQGTRRRIDKASLHRQMGLAFRKFDELGDILETAAERMFYAPTEQSRAANRPSMKRRQQRGGRRQRGVGGRFERATGQDGDEAGEASRVDSGGGGLEYPSGPLRPGV